LELPRFNARRFRQLPFTKLVTHPLLGLLIHQSAVFQESAWPY
jgi:hypothetical protein